MLFPKKCPLCGTKMSTVNGVLTCPDCGYNESFIQSSYTTSESSHAYCQAPVGEQSSHSNTSQNTSPNALPHTARPYEQYLNQSQANNTAPVQSFAEITAQRRAAYGDERQKTGSRTLIVCLALLIVFILIFVPVLALFFTSFDHKASSGHNEYATHRPGSNAADVADLHDTYTENTPEEAALTVPQSEFFSQMMSLIFNKEIGDLSVSDAEQIVSLRVYEVNYDYNAVDYKLTDGTSGTVYPASQRPDVSDDLTCFVNLEELYLEDSYGRLNLNGLDKLHTLYTDEYISDIKQIVPAAQITSLGIYDTSFSFSGLDAFENVENLYLEGSMLSDINEISKLPKLKNLTIMDGDYIDDLSALYSATQLESLYIESNSLRDVTFLTKFDNLKELTIIGSEVLDFTPLAACTGLEKLYLLENYDASDYEFVKNLTGLKEFGLMSSFNFDDSDMPDLSALSNVTKLHLGKFENFDNLKYMTNVEELIIDDGGYGNFGSSNALLSLPNLRSLTLINSSVSPEMLRQISEAKGLESLNLYSSYLWDSIDPLLSMPNLKELNLRYASFMLNTDKIVPNETLRVLNLNNAQISKYNSDQWSVRENIDVEKLQDALANFHGIEELMLENLTINNVAFTEEMKHLKVLNITNNYVTSLAPLKNLSELQIIVCETNPISDTAELDHLLVK